MDAGWVGAIASLLSALVVAVAALAAFIQVRHIRNTNNIAVYTQLIEFMDRPEIVAARMHARTVEQELEDPVFRARLMEPAVIPEWEDIGFLLRFLEHFAVLVGKGGVAESLVMAEYADTFEDLWDQLREAIYLRRYAFGAYTGRAFEHLAMRAHAYRNGPMAREYAALLRDERPSVYGTPPAEGI